MGCFVRKIWFSVRLDEASFYGGFVYEEFFPAQSPVENARRSPAYSSCWLGCCDRRLGPCDGGVWLGRGATALGDFANGVVGGGLDLVSESVAVARAVQGIVRADGASIWVDPDCPNRRPHG